MCCFVMQGEILGVWWGNIRAVLGVSCDFLWIAEIARLEFCP
jgi:hypothetical protein